MIFQSPRVDEPIDQGDIVDGCPILSLDQYDPESVTAPKINVSPCRVLVLTQACDLAQGKATTATVAVVYEARTLVDQGLLKAADVRGPIRSGRVFGWYFLPMDDEGGLPEVIVDLRQLHTVRLDLLAVFCQRGLRRARLCSPFREHLAKHFADTYSRIGLPLPYATE